MERKYLVGIFAFSIIAVLGFSFVSAFGFGNGFGFSLTDEEKTEMKAKQETIQNAIENGDYESWAELMQQKVNKMQSEITKENFVEVQGKYFQMTELKEAMEEARESEDFSEVESLMAKFGIGKGFEKGQGHKMNAGANPDFERGNFGEGKCPCFE